MWKQKIGISVYNQYAIPTTDVVKLIKQTGFDAVSPEWCEGVDLTDVIQTARDCGLYVQSLHAPYAQAADMWNLEEAVFKPATDTVLQSLEDCHKFHIPILVVHTWIGFQYTFDNDHLNFQNYDRLVSQAEAYGIQIAFENTEGDEFLFALMEHFKENPTVGFCWDSGHELCYNHSQDLLALLGDRLLITHLNDNLGISRFDGNVFWTDDLHLLPYDGIADWSYNIKRLQKSKRLEYLNFELNLNSKPNRHENDIYSQMPLEQYYSEAYKRACRIAYNYSLPAL